MLSPLRLVTILVFVLAAGWRVWPRWLRAILVGAAVVLVVSITPFGANLLIGLQESRASTPEACRADPPQTVVVLSGGVASIPADMRDYGALSGASLRRLFAAMAFYREWHPAQVVFVGTTGSAVVDADVMASLATAVGMPAEAIRVEPDSLTTWENALKTAALQPSLPKKIWLLTSALHMPRALYAFREAGFEPCAWPVASQYRGFDGFGYFLPTGSSALKAEDAIHEMVGELGYRSYMSWRQPAPAGSRAER